MARPDQSSPDRDEAASGAGPRLCCPPISDPALDEAAAEDLVGVLKALADPVRLRIVNLVAQEVEVCACDLPELLDRTQPTISHHLSVLVDAGLLLREKRGKWAWFRLHREQLGALSSAISPPS